MDRVKLNTLIDKLIGIKDRQPLSFEERETINEACNLIEHNMDVLVKEE